MVIICMHGIIQITLCLSVSLGFHLPFMQCLQWRTEGGEVRYTLSQFYCQLWKQDQEMVLASKMQKRSHKVRTYILFIASLACQTVPHKRLEAWKQRDCLDWNHLWIIVHMTTKPFEEVQKFTLKALSKSDLILTLQQKGSPQECCQLMEGTHLSACQPVIGSLSFFSICCFVMIIWRDVWFHHVFLWCPLWLHSWGH